MQTSSPIEPARLFAPVRAVVADVKGFLPQGGTLSDESWRARHRGVLVLLALHAIAVPVYAVVRHLSLDHILVESAILPAATVVAALPSLRRRTRTMAAAVGLLSASGILVHLSGGLIEMHFHFFVMVAVVSLYQDWLPFLAAIAYVLVHHGIVGVLDPYSVYNHPAAVSQPWKWAGIHALFIAGISAASLVTWRLNEVYLAHRRDAERRLGVVADASRQFLSTLDVESVLGTLGDLVVPDVADVCIIDVVEADGTLRRIGPVAAPEHREALRALQGRPPAPDNHAHPVVQSLQSQEASLIDEVTPDLIDRAFRDSAHHEQLLAMSSLAGSAMIVPLIARGTVIAVMTAATFGRGARRLGAEDLSMAEELARRAAAAAENARLYATQREAAETLQHSLLPEHLPQPPAVEIGARYVAGGAGNEVGGDWYDILTIADGSIGVVMGDVVGRGIPAASVMGQLRHALRAFAVEGIGPAEVMTRLNALLDALDVREQMATVCYGVFDLDTGCLTYANAGHPPPILTSRDGTCVLLDEVAGVPLGVRPGARYSEAQVTMRADDTLLLYTDGLVEDRAVSLDVGIAAVCATSQRSVEDDVDTFCDRVLNTATGGRAIDDDVAILALRYVPFADTVDVTLPAQPWVLRPLRSALRRWLREAGATDEETFAILVAVGEACSNVMRHASPAVTTFGVAGSRNGEIRLDVRDAGRWRDAPPRQFGGRGLSIIREFVDDVSLTKGPPETVVSMRRRLAQSYIA